LNKIFVNVERYSIMTELKPNMVLRYYTTEKGKHYTAVVLKGDTILSVKKAGEKDKTIYNSLIHWLATLPGSVTTSDLDIREPGGLFDKKKDTLTLKDIAPTYDLLRFLLTYEAYSLENSFTSIKNTLTRKTHTYVQDADGTLHPVKYNRHIQKLYSEYHSTFGSTLEEIGFPANSPIYVSIPSKIRNKGSSLELTKFPFTSANYESFYDAKFAFIVDSHISNRWEYKNNKFHTLLCSSLKEHGYYIYTERFKYYILDSIFVNKMYKYLECNCVVIVSTHTNVIVQNFKPFGVIRIRP